MHRPDIELHSGWQSCEIGNALVIRHRLSTKAKAALLFGVLFLASGPLILSAVPESGDPDEKLVVLFVSAIYLLTIVAALGQLLKQQRTIKIEDGVVYQKKFWRAFHAVGSASNLVVKRITVSTSVSYREDTVLCIQNAAGTIKLFGGISFTEAHFAPILDWVASSARRFQWPTT